jgi:hypothetical protein
MAATYNLVCPQATTFTFQFQVATNGTAWNLSGYTITMTIRPFLGSTTTTLTATIANGRVTVDAPNGRVTVVLPASITNLAANSYVYDVVFNSGTQITRILEGQFIVTAGVTV